MESYTCYRKCSGSVGRIIFLLWYEALRRNPAFILSLRRTVFRVRFEMFEHSDAMMWVDVGGGLEMNSIRAFDDWIQIIKELDCVVIRHENEINSAENSFLRLSGLETRFWSFGAAFYGLTVHIKLLMAEFKFASQFRCLCVDIHSFATQIPSFSLCSNINRATRVSLTSELERIINSIDGQGLPTKHRAWATDTRRKNHIFLITQSKHAREDLGY